MKSKKDAKRQRAALLGMPYGTAEKRLRKAMIYELARQCGKNKCRWCESEISSPDDLAVVHLQDWSDDADLFWDLNNVAFSHVSCAAERGGIQQEDQMERIKVTIVDHQGSILSGVNHEGQIYVAGIPGMRYMVRVKNTTGKRVLAVITVDGRNVLSGEKGGFSDRGYILSPYESADIDGWRQTDEKVAAFVFGKKKGSYSAQKGTPENVGVIGVALFEEKEIERHPFIYTIGHTTHHHHHHPYPVPSLGLFSHDTGTGGAVPASTTITSDTGDVKTSGGISVTSSTVAMPAGAEVNTVYTAASAAPAGAEYSTSSLNLRSERSAKRRPMARRRRGGGQSTQKAHKQEIGTEYGDTIESAVRSAPFERATDNPCEVHEVRYDTMEALKRAGIMGSRPSKRPKQPSSFPQEPEVTAGYCEPPPKRARR